MKLKINNQSMVEWVRTEPTDKPMITIEYDEPYQARPTGNKYYNRNYSTFVEYEYRGQKYEVEYSNCIDYLVTSPSVQHRNAQTAIDLELETPKKPYRYEDTAEYGFNLAMEYFDS